MDLVGHVNVSFQETKIIYSTGNVSQPVIFPVGKIDVTQLTACNGTRI